MQKHRLTRAEILFLGAVLTSTCGDVLIPTAFALESLRIDASGAGFTAVLITLWIGRLIGASLFQHFSADFSLLRIMLSADAIRLCAQAGLAVWILTAESTVSALAISSLVYGVATAFFIPARFSATTGYVKPTELQRFNSLISLTENGLRLIAPAAATAFFLTLGFPAILFFDAATFIIGMILLALLPRAVPVKKPRSNATAPTQSNRASSRSLTDFRDFPRWAVVGLIVWTVLSAVIGFCGAAGPALLLQRFDERTWALVAMASAAGSIVGSAGQLTGILVRISWTHLLTTTSILLGMQVALYALGNSLIFLTGIVFLAAIAVTVAGIAWDTHLQLKLGDATLRRFANWDDFFSSSAVFGGMLLFGLAAFNSLQAGSAVVLGIACVLCAVAVILFQSSRSTPTHS